MATANSNGGKHRRKDDEQPDPDRTQRVRGMQEVVDRWFSDDPDDEPTERRQMDNRVARRMNRQLEDGERTTGRPGCWPATLATLALVGALGWGVR